MNKKSLQEKLINLQDKNYQSFQYKLIPSVKADSIIGVRTPDLRAIAKEMNKDNYKEEFINDLPHLYFEENQIHSFLIGLEKDFDKVLVMINGFLPYIDNWATCDQATPVALKKKPDIALIEIKKWIDTNKPYYIRYGVGVLLALFLDDLFEVGHLEIVANIHSDEYYVQMMQGWYFATALAKQYDYAIKYIEKGLLDKGVNNITIKKAIESYRITEAQKEYLRKYRIK